MDRMRAIAGRELCDAVAVEYDRIAPLPQIADVEIPSVVESFEYGFSQLRKYVAELVEKSKIKNATEAALYFIRASAVEYAEEAEKLF